MLVEVVRVSGLGAAEPQRPVGHRITPRRPAQSEVDAARISGLQQGELFGHDERCVVGQHDPARTDPHPVRGGGDHGDQHRRVGGGHGRHVVVFGDPEPVDSGGVCHAGQLQAGPEGISGRLTGPHRDEVEHREAQPAAVTTDRDRGGGEIRSSHRRGNAIRPVQHSRMPANPVGPPRSHTATGGGTCASHPGHPDERRRDPMPHPRPVAVSDAAPTTDRASTSEPTLVRPPNTAPPTPVASRRSSEKFISGLCARRSRNTNRTPRDEADLVRTVDQHRGPGFRRGRAG